MDHDRLFKQLMHEFFGDFLSLFLPEVAGYIEAGSIEFLDKEVFTDLTAGDRHEVDLLVKCRFRGREAFFLVHVETQSSVQENFAERMYHYFARLTEKHGLPVYPIALFTYDVPMRAEQDRYEIGFPDLAVLKFQFQTIQLNRLSWRDFMRRPNPVAVALMVKMRIAPEDRPWVQLECLRLLVTLKLDPAKQWLIRDFMTAYLRLSDEEQTVYDRELKIIDKPEQEAIMEIIDQWEERGAARGEARGMVNIVLRLIHRRFGELPGALRDRVAGLPVAKVEALADALLDFASVSDVEAWLVANA